jgi:ketosteroid isomerase-like protein
MTTTVSETRAQAEVLAVLDAWSEATREVDVPRVLALYAPGVRAFDAVGGLEFKGIDAYGAHWRACMDGLQGQMVFELRDVTIETEGDLALAHFLARCGYVDPDGVDHSGWMRGTMALRRGAEGWRITHEHYSHPFDPETMKVETELTP